MSNEKFIIENSHDLALALKVIAEVHGQDTPLSNERFEEYMDALKNQNYAGRENLLLDTGDTLENLTPKQRWSFYEELEMEMAFVDEQIEEAKIENATQELIEFYAQYKNLAELQITVLSSFTPSS